MDWLITESLTKVNYMTDQDVKAAIASLRDACRFMDELGELKYFIEAVDILSETLLDGNLSDYWDGDDKDSAWEKFNKVQTHLRIIKHFSSLSNKFVNTYEDKMMEKLSKSHELLTEIIAKPSEDKFLAIPTNSTLESCNSFIVDNSEPPDYYYW